MSAPVYGWWVIYDSAGTEVHRITGHYRKGSATWESADDGLESKIDFGRYDVEWQDNPEAVSP